MLLQSRAMRSHTRTHTRFSMSLLDFIQAFVLTFFLLYSVSLFCFSEYTYRLVIRRRHTIGKETKTPKNRDNFSINTKVIRAISRSQKFQIVHHSTYKGVGIEMKIQAIDPGDFFPLFGPLLRQARGIFSFLFSNISVKIN